MLRKMTTRNTNATTKFINLRGCMVKPIDRGSVWRSCGKPSTKFPHEGLVERLFIMALPLSSRPRSFLKKRNSMKSYFVKENLDFPIWGGNLECHRPGNGIRLSIFQHIYIDLHDTLDKVFCALFSK